MNSAVALGLLAMMAPSGASVGGRIAASYEAAQALQGELDGAWTLRDLAGAPLYRFEIVDPPQGAPLEAAWGLPGATAGASGGARVTLGGGSRLALAFVRQGEPVSVRLTRSRGGAWTGRLFEGFRTLRVVLRRERRIGASGPG